MLADLFGWLRADTSGGAELIEDSLFRPHRRLRPMHDPNRERTTDQQAAEAFHRILITEARKEHE